MIFIESINCLTLQMQEDSSPLQDSHLSDLIQSQQANAVMTNQTSLITAI